MKKTGFWVRVLLLSLACVFMCMHAVAAPGKTSITGAKPGDGQATLKWKAASGAKGYIIYVEKKDGSLQKFRKVNGGKKTKSTIKNLKNNVTYVFHVAAFDGKSTGQPSAGRSVTPSFGNIPQVKNFMVVRVVSRKARVRWTKMKNVAGYQVFMLNEATGAYEVVKQVGRNVNTCVISNLKNGHDYSFKVRAFKQRKGEYGYGPMSKTIVATPQSGAVLKATSMIHPCYYKAKMKRSVTTPEITIPSGKAVTVTEFGKATSKVYYKGKTVKVPSSSFKRTAIITKYKKAYSRSLAENYVNTRSFDSLTDYLIWISTYTQHIYVFKGSRGNWKCVLDTICSTGRLGFETPQGTSYVEHKDAVVFFTFNKAYPDPSSWAVQGGFYGLKIAGGYIHSTLYNITKIVDANWDDEHPDVRPKKSYNLNSIPSGALLWGVKTFGTPVSKGCVRVPMKEVKWMFENIPYNTRVWTY